MISQPWARVPCTTKVFFFEYTSEGEMKKRHVYSSRPLPAKYFKTDRSVLERLHQKALSIAPGLKANPDVPE